MKSLQEYIELYRGIARRLNLRGDSIEMLSQLLGNATYISEVEHLSYTQEASLERASQLNSKIQHCMNEMYSVFRGSCPRVLIHFTSLSYLEYNIFDEIATFNNFSLYYLGYHDPNSYVSGESPILTYSPVSIPPNQEMTIVALISPKKLLANWTINFYNQYYVDFLESNLSNDIQVKVDGELYRTTRIFSDHIKDGSIFDLTLPDFGLRLYAPDVFRKETQTIEELSEIPTGTKISLEAFRFSELSSYNNSELKQIKVKGTKLKPFEISMWGSYGSELSDGLIFIKEVSRDSLNTIHYKANRDKFVGSILRSNSDIGYLLEEMYPEKVYKSGTSYKFEEVKKTPKKTTIFGFEPNNTKDLEEGANYLCLTSPSSGENTLDLSSLKTELKDRDNNGGLLTVYSAKDYPVFIYFNDNPEINFVSEKFPQMSFSGSKLTLGATGSFKNNKPYGGIIQIPIPNSGSGVLRIFHKAALDIASHTIYQIFLENDIIVEEEGYSELTVSSIKKISDGFIQMIPSDKFENNNYIFTCELVYNNGETDKEPKSNVLGKFNISTENKNLKEVRVSLYFKNSDDNTPDTNNLLAQEVIPVLRSYNDNGTSVKTAKANDLRLNLSTDLISIESDKEGTILTKFPITVYSTTFYQGLELKGGVRYTVEKDTGIDCEIDSTTGLLTITSIDNKAISSESILLISASYSGITITVPLVLRTSITENAYKTRVINISADSTGNENSILARYNSGLVESISEFTYKNIEGNAALYLWLSGIGGVDIYSLEWISDEAIEKTESSLYPKLSVYYIPKTPSSVLSALEINKFVESRKSYFVTQEISVLRGTRVNALITLGVSLFKNVSIDAEVNSVLSKYSNSFNLDLDSKINEIRSSLGKISNIKSLEEFKITYTTELGDEISEEDYKELDFDYTYFVIEHQINSTISNN